MTILILLIKYLYNFISTVYDFFYLFTNNSMWYLLSSSEFPDMSIEKEIWINKTTETDEAIKQLDLPNDNATATREALKKLDMQQYVSKLFQTVRTPERPWDPFNNSYFSEEWRALLKFAAHLLVSKPSNENVIFLVKQVDQLMPEWAGSNEVCWIIAENITMNAASLHKAGVSVSMDNPEEVKNLFSKKRRLVEQLTNDLELSEDRKEKMQELWWKYAINELELLTAKNKLNKE